MLVSIQILRALAAIMVVAYHCGLGPADLGNAANNNVLAAGVDIFFVISGFVMMVSTSKRSPSFPAFMSARILRIVPPYWIATAIMCAVLIAHGRYPPAHEVILSLLFIPYTSSLDGRMNPVLVPGWTLDYEMFFYLLFGLTLRFGRPRQLCLLAAVFALLVCLRPLLGHLGAAGFRYTSPLLFEFFGGAVLGAFLKPRKAGPGGLLLILAGCLSGLALSLLLPRIPRIIDFGIPAILIVAGSVMSEAYLGKAPVGFLVFLGNASYSIYLLHSFGIEAAARIPLVPDAGRKIAGLLFGTVAGIAGYLVLERPVLRLLKQMQGDFFLRGKAALVRQPNAD